MGRHPRHRAAGRCPRRGAAGHVELAGQLSSGRSRDVEWVGSGQAHWEVRASGRQGERDAAPYLCCRARGGGLRRPVVAGRAL